ncbi:MAG: filamentous hemagglutinin N-terminal domain-containing protein [Pseudomonadales bacterium]|nr:filamentous hemagglutinin N-terminal domain-containing protein [Pseudomonadales bacterium]
MHLLALPKGETVTVGQANLSHPDASTFHVQQQSQKLSINYQSFDIAGNEKVVFQQPNADAIVLNRVIGGTRSEIFGSISANGQVFLLNPQGIVFSKNAQVNVAGLVASTLNLSDEDFINGRYRFEDAVQGSSIVNQGSLNSATGGYIALLAPVVINQGDIEADQGNINLHSAEAVLVEFTDGLNILTTRSSWLGRIENSGFLSATAGRIVLDAQTRGMLYQTAVNNDGIIEAHSIEEINGRIFLRANEGDVINQGRIDASALEDGHGGDIVILAGRFAQAGELSTDGKGTGNGGRIDVRSSETILIDAGSLTTSNAGIHGDGGEVVFFSAQNTVFEKDATITARGGSSKGDGGFVEVSGVKNIWVQGEVDTTAVDGAIGTFYIDPSNIEIVVSAAPANGTFNGGSWEPSAGSSQIEAALISNLLKSTSVFIDTATPLNPVGPDPGQVGTLTLSTDIDLTDASTMTGGSTATLTLRSDGLLWLRGNICVGGVICSAGTGSINLVLDSAENFVTDGFTEINTGGGDLTVTAENGAGFGAASSITTGGGFIDIDASGLIDIGDSATINSGGGLISITNVNAGFLDDRTAISTGVSFSSGGGNIAFFSFDGDISVDTFSSPSFDTGGGDLSFTSPNLSSSAINLENSTFSNINDLSMTANFGTLILPDAVITVSNRISLDAVEIIDKGADALQLNANELVFSALVQTADTVLITNVNQMDLRVGDSGAFSTTVTNTGNLELLDLDIDGSNLALSVNDMHVFISATGGSLTLNGDAQLGGGIGNTLQLLANTTATINGNMTSTGNASVFQIFSTAGNVVVSDGVVINAGSGQININANGDATITGLTTTRATATDDIIISAGGSILDGGDTNLDISVTSGEVDLTAVSGIVNLEIDANTGNFTNTGSGDISINESNNIIINIIDAVSDFSLDAGTSIVVNTAITDVENLTLSAINNLIIPNAGLNIGIANTQVMNLIGGDIYNQDESRTLSLTSNTLSFHSGLAGGATIINSDVGQLSLTNFGTAALTVNEIDNVRLLFLSMRIGDVTVTTAGNLSIPASGGLNLNGNGSSTLTLTGATNFAIDGDIIDTGSGTHLNFTSTTGSIVINTNAVINSGGGNILFLASTGTIDVDDGDILSNGGDISLVANAAGEQVRVQSTSNVNAASGQIFISGNSLLLTNIRSDSTSNTAIQLISATDIQDDGAGVDARADNGRIVLSAATGITDAGSGFNFDVRTASLDVTNTSSGLVSLDITNDTDFFNINVVDDFTAIGSGSITISNTPVWGAQVAISAANDIILPDITLAASSNLALTANDIYDSNRVVSLDAPVLAITTATGAGNSIFNVNVDELIVQHLGSNHLTVNDDGSLDILMLSMAAGNTIITTTENMTIPSASSVSLSGSGTQSLSLTANNDLIISDNIIDSGSGTNLLFMSVNGSLSVDSNAAINSNGGDIILSAINSGALVNVNSGSSVDSGSATILVNGDAVRITGLTSNSTANNAVAIFSNTTIRDYAGIDVTAAFGGVILEAKTGIFGTTGTLLAFDVAARKIDVTNSLSGSVIFDLRAETEFLDIDVVDFFSARTDTGVNDITISNITRLGVDATFTVNRNIILPDAGLTTSNSITLIADDIFDSDRSLSFTTATLDVRTASTAANSIFNTSIDNFLIQHNGDNKITVNEADGLVINGLSMPGLVLTSGDLEINATDITLAANADLDGAVASQLSLIASNDLIINGDLLDITGAIDNDTDLLLTAGNAFSVLDGVTIHAGLGVIAVSANSVKAHGLFSNSSANNAISVTSLTNISDGVGTDISAMNGGVILSATTGIQGGGAVQTFDISAAKIDITNSISGDVILDVNTGTDFINIDVAAGFSAISQAGANDIQISGFTLAADLSLLAGGDIILLDSGLSVSGLLELTAEDIFDSDRLLNFTADQLIFSSRGAAADTTLITAVNSIDLSADQQSLFVIQNQNVIFSDLNNSGSAVTIANGDFFATIDGDVLVNDVISVADIIDNGIRKAGLALDVTGDLQVLANLQSVNTVDDEIAHESLGNTAIQLRNTSSSLDVTFMFGDGVGNDVRIEADGGDILIDLFVNAAPGLDNGRSIILQSDVSLLATQSGLNDGGGMVSISDNTANSASLISAHTGNQIRINGVFDTPDPNNEDIINEIQQLVSDETADKKVAEELVLNSEKDMQTDFNALTGDFFTACTPQQGKSQSGCELEQAIIAFLGTLLIGGQLPDLQ